MNLAQLVIVYLSGVQVVERLSLKNMKDGKINDLDAFNNSDILFVDHTDAADRLFLR